MLGRRIAIAATLTLLAACSQGPASDSGTSAKGTIAPATSTVASPASTAAGTPAPTTTTAIVSTNAAGTVLAIHDAAGLSAAQVATVSGAARASKISMRLLPQIAQQGSAKSSPTKAKNAIEVSVSPKRRTQVRLQVKSGKKWVNVAAARTAKNGKHVFQANAKRKGKWATYRVAVGKKASAAASTAIWKKSDFTDTFSSGVRSKYWNHQRQHYNPEGLRRCSKGSPKAATTSRGVLRLSVLKDTSKRSKCTGTKNGKRHGKYDWRLNGNISTQGKYSFKYGYAAARMKFPRAMGQHGSFWMQPVYSKPGTVDPKLTGAEIDVIESFGERYSKKNQGMTSFTYHWKLQGNKGVRVKTGGYIPNITSFLANKSDNWWDKYHVFSVEWTPNYYIFRIDGKETWRSYVGVSGQAQYLALSLLSSDYELGLLKGDQNLPQHMYVDWVRVWETGR